MIRAVTTVLTVLLLAACTGDEDEGEGDSGRGVDEVIVLIDELASVEKVVRVTDGNDPNEMIGRPDGYSDAAVFYDSRRQCREPGIECGAFLEVWDDADEAKARSEYIKALQMGMQGLGSEYHFFEGAMLLRVTGNLKRHEAEEYEAALRG